MDAPQRSTGFREFHYLFATEGVARPLLFFGRDLPFLPFADERHVLITPPSGGVASVDLAHPQAPPVVLFDQPVRSRCLSPSQRWLAIVDQNQALHVVDLSRPAPPLVQRLRPEGGAKYIFFASRRDDLFVIDPELVLSQISLDEQSERRVVVLAEDPKHFAFASNGRYLALGGAAAERLQVVDLGTPSTLTLTAPLGFTGAWKDFGFLGDGLRLFANGLSVAHVSSASGDFAEPWIRLTAPGTGPDAPRMTNSTDGRWTAVWTLDSDASHFNLYDHSQTPPTLREVSKRGSDIQSVDFTPDSQYAVAVSRHRITRRYGLFTVRVNELHVGRTITFGQARRAPRVFLRRFTADGASMELYGTEQVAQRNDNNFRVTLHRSVPAQPLLSNTIPGDENSLPWHLGSRRIFYVARTGELKAVGQTSEGDELGGGHLGLAPG